MGERSGPYRGHEPGRPAPNGEPAAAQAAPAGRRSAAQADPAGGLALLDRFFGRPDITEVRHEVAARAIAVGLSGDRLHGFVLAVNELITNAVLHGGGHGRLGLRVVGDSLVCLVVDRGTGIPERFRSASATPPVSAVGGRGIWLAFHLCDEVRIDAGPAGTTITARVTLPARGPLPGLVDTATSSN